MRIDRLQLKEAKKWWGKGEKSLLAFLEKKKIMVITDEDGTWVEQHKFDLELTKPFLVQLIKNHGENWHDEYKRIRTGLNPLIDNLTVEEIKLFENVSEELGSVIPTQINADGLSLPKRKIPGLYIKCNKCGKVSKKKLECKQNGNGICVEPQKQVYLLRVHIPGTKHEEEVFTLKAKNPSDAVIEAEQIRRQLKNNGFSRSEVDKARDKKKEMTLDNLLTRYQAHLNNEGVAVFEKRHRTKAHKQDIISTVNILKKVIEAKGYDGRSFPIKNFNEELAESTLIYIRGVAKKARTFNKKVGFVKSFFSYINQNEQVVKNYFEKVTRQQGTKKAPKAIPIDLFKKLINRLNDPTKELAPDFNYSDNLWLRNFILLTAFTGRRRKEVYALKYSDIKIENGVHYINCANIKDTRIKDFFTYENDKPVPVSITKDFKLFLRKIGYNEAQANEKQIIPANFSTDIDYIIDKISRGVSFYMKSIGSQLTLTNIRKLYNTQSFFINTDYTGLAIGGGHEQPTTTMKHYVDEIERLRPLNRRCWIFTEQEIETLIP